MKKVCVIGHFGFGKELLNGQTIKTKIVTEELERQLGKKQVMKIDTHGGVKSLLKMPFQTFSALKKCDNIIIFPAYNGLRIITPVLSLENKLFHRKLHYAVIGGWLPNFVENRRVLKNLLQHFDHIYVETSTMKKALKKQGFKNIVIMPNCKKLHILEESELVYNTSEPYKLCTFSRVMKEKGIEDAINAVKAVNKKMGRIVYELDIYGQVDSEQIEWFEALKKTFPEYVRYKGLVPFDKTVDVVKKYYLLLFPTFYEGEGFAGTIIDAFAAGVPVIASNWKYNSELVSNQETGIIVEPHNIIELSNKLEWALYNRHVCISMKLNCIQIASNYKPNKVVQVLMSYLK